MWSYRLEYALAFDIQSAEYIKQEFLMTQPHLDFLFRPRSIALAGVSADTSWPGPAQWYLMSMIKFGYKGRIYPLHPAGGEIHGLKIYKNMADIPER